jgi:hypothetical protein
VDSAKAIKGSASGKGMILPFQPMALTFHNVCYFVPYPPVRAQASSGPAPPLLFCREQILLLYTAENCSFLCSRSSGKHVV